RDAGAGCDRPGPPRPQARPRGHPDGSARGGARGVTSDGEHLRADARRNLERILEAAAEVFAERGADASVADVARRAGVGHATVFRRFPTKEHLLIALMAQRMEALAARAAAEAATEPREEALERFMEHLAGHFAKDRGFKDSTARACAMSR